jgi:hypothetical protein
MIGAMERVEDETCAVASYGEAVTRMKVAAISLSTLLDRKTYQGTDTYAYSAKRQRASETIVPKYVLTVAMCRLQRTACSAGHGADEGAPFDDSVLGAAACRLCTRTRRRSGEAHSL